MTQTKDELEAWYQQVDPWSYKTNPDDQERKRRILGAIPGKYKRALDIGAGEGWITKDLPAKEIHGLEWSDVARERIPAPAVGVDAPSGTYDLIAIMGLLYPQYETSVVAEVLANHLAPHGTLITCNIKEWEQELPLKWEHVEEFPYRDYTQILRRFIW